MKGHWKLLNKRRNIIPNERWVRHFSCKATVQFSVLFLTAMQKLVEQYINVWKQKKKQKVFKHKENFFL